MRKKTLGMLLVVALALAAPSSGQENNGTLQLSLEECIVRALRDNLGVAIQVLGPEISGEGVSRAQEKYIPSLSLSVNSRNTENATFSYLDAQQDSTVDKTQNFTFLSASQALPTGGNLTLDFTGYKTSTNRTGQTINPRYGTTLRFNFSQPLLRNFGFKMSRREIQVAVNALGISEEQLRRTLTDTVYNVESAYWNLVYSIENLEVRRQSLALAKDLLEKNQRSVEVGTMAPMDVLSARAEVATREADIIQAEMEVETRADQLKALLNLPTDGDQAVDILLPKDKPTFEEKSFDLDEALALAVQNRTDLAIAKIGIKNDELDLSYAKNQALPDLNLSASFSSPGIDGTTILYDGNPILGNVIGTIPGGISGALRQTTTFKYPNWNVGLTLSLPLANVFSRASLAQARLNMRQAMLDLEYQKQQVYLEIKNAVRSVDANHKRILAYTTARELAEQKLAAEEEKRRVGLSTNYLVLLLQRDLASARISELNAIIAYNVSLASLERSMGTNLKSRNVTVADYSSGLN
ncbi:MAG: TolC family protein [Candidatus Aminicenantes bacterium]